MFEKILKYLLPGRKTFSSKLVFVLLNDVGIFENSSYLLNPFIFLQTSMHFFPTWNSVNRMFRFIWPDADVDIWAGRLAVLPSKNLAGEMHLEIHNSFQKARFYTCYKSQMPWVPLSFLWLWKEECVSNPGTASVLMADISSQVGWIPVPESLPDNTSTLPISYLRATISLYLIVKQTPESFMSFIFLKQWW